MRRWIGSLLVLLALPATAGVESRSYDRAVDLIDRMYLYPKEVTAAKLLQASATALAGRLHWLVVEVDGDAVYLRHGDGSPVGAVSVAHLGTLAEALRSLESVVLEAGYPLGDVDVRLELLRGLGDGLDRYSQVLDGERLERFDDRLKGTLVGVGVGLVREGDGLRIGEVVEGGPAALAGVRVGDRLQRIDGWATLNMPVKEASRRIRGEVGAEVVLDLLRGEEAISVRLTRAEIVEANVGHAVLEGQVGYVSISHFSQRTIENLTAALRTLRAEGGLDHGLVIDLRGNTGGSMKEAAKAADLFVKEGLLLRTVGRDGREVQNLQAEIQAVDDGNEPPIPIAILVDDKTASGSEILAGALLQLDRAVLIGGRTYGKGTVQKVYTLDEYARLKLTVAEYLLADDRRIAGDGLVPDLTLRPVRFDAQGARFPGWVEASAVVPWVEILPVVSDGEPAGDAARELARRSLLGASGPGRAALLASLQTEAETEREAQNTRLVEAFAAREVDWSPAAEPGEAPNARVSVRAERIEGQPDQVRLVAEVENQSEGPLHRAIVALKSPDYPLWDGLLIPVGLVPPGELRTGAHQVGLRTGVVPREDEVQTTLLSDQRPAMPGDAVLLGARSSERPELVVSARLLGEGSERRAELRIKNTSKVGLVGVEASFEFPGEVDFDLVDGAARVPLLLGGQEEVVELGLRLGPGAPAALPLSVHVEVERFGELVDGWPLRLPVDGAAVRLQAPGVSVSGLSVAAPVGPARFPVKVTDDSQIAHAVVWLNGEKVAWFGGGGPAGAFTATGAWVSGPNRLVVVATDDQGLVTRKQWTVRGEPPATVDAAD